MLFLNILASERFLPFNMSYPGYASIFNRFYTSDVLSVWTNMGKHFFFVWLFVSSIKTDKRRIMRLDELSFEIRLERRTKRDSSS